MKASCLVKHSTIAFLSWAVTLNGWVETVAAATLPEGFEETVVFSGLVNPMSVRFSPDGRVFVAEKRGVIKVFDSLNDTTPDVFADLNVNVYNFWDRGLMSLALDPDFPDVPWVYVLYAYDAEIGGVAPRWGTPGVYSDPCPNPPGATMPKSGVWRLAGARRASTPTPAPTRQGRPATAVW